MKTLLVCVDFSDLSGQVVLRASKLAKAFKERLLLLHVTEPDPDFIGFSTGPQTVRDQWAKKFRKEHAEMNDMQQKLAETGLDVQGIVVQGHVADKILEHAEKLDADMILMGTHGHGCVHNLLVGSVAEEVLRHATRPVVLVPARVNTNAL